jgi:hypothetical protein
MRLQNIVIALLIFLAVATVLFTQGENFVMSYNSSDVLIDNESSRMFAPLHDELNRTRTDIGLVAKKSPAGADSRIPDDFTSTSSDTALSISALSAITSLGRLLFSTPLVLMELIASTENTN